MVKTLIILYTSLLSEHWYNCCIFHIFKREGIERRRDIILNVADHCRTIRIDGLIKQFDNHWFKIQLYKFVLNEYEERTVKTIQLSRIDEPKVWQMAASFCNHFLPLKYRKNPFFVSSFYEIGFWMVDYRNGLIASSVLIVWRSLKVFLYNVESVSFNSFSYSDDIPMRNFSRLKINNTINKLLITVLSPSRLPTVEIG